MEGSRRIGIGLWKGVVSFYDLNFLMHRVIFEDVHLLNDYEICRASFRPTLADLRPWT